MMVKTALIFCCLASAGAFGPIRPAATTAKTTSLFSEKVTSSTSDQFVSDDIESNDPPMVSMRRSSAAGIPDPSPQMEYAPEVPELTFKWMPVRSVLKFLSCQVILGGLFLVLLPVNLVASTAFIFLKPWLNKVTLRRYLGFMMTYKMTPWIEIMFDIDRITTYVPHLIRAKDRLFQIDHDMRTVEELVGPNRIPSDGQFISQCVLRSPMAWYTRVTDKELVVDMSLIDTVETFPNCYLDINKVVIDKATEEITLFHKELGPISRKTHGEEFFDKAMVHCMASMSYFIPGIGHSWVHFLMMDAASAVVKNDVTDPILKKFLMPHFKHTSRINWEALGPRGHVVWGDSAINRMAQEVSYQVPEGEPGDLFTNLFKPWAPFPMKAEEFVRKNSERTTQYYFYPKDGETETEFSCPPKWIENRDNEETYNTQLPYIRAVRRFYPIIREYTAKVLEQVPEEALTSFIENVDNASEVDGKRLDLSRFDPVDVVTSMIYNGVFIHSTDHHWMHEIFRKGRYGVITLRHPLDTTWYPGKNVPADMMLPADQVRFISFADCFVRWNDHSIPFLSNKMQYLNYGIEGDGKDIGQEMVDAIKAEQDKMEEEGDMFTPMDKLSRSICW